MLAVHICMSGDGTAISDGILLNQSISDDLNTSSNSLDVPTSSPSATPANALHDIDNGDTAVLCSSSSSSTYGQPSPLLDNSTAACALLDNGFLLRRQVSSTLLSPTCALSPMSCVSSTSSSSTTMDSGRSSATDSGLEKKQRKSSKKKALAPLILNSHGGQRMFKFHYYSSQHTEKTTGGPPDSSPCSVTASPDTAEKTPSFSSSGCESDNSPCKPHIDSFSLHQQTLNWQDQQKQQLTLTLPLKTPPEGSSQTTLLQVTPSAIRPVLNKATTPPVNTVAPTIVNKSTSVDSGPTVLPPINQLINMPVQVSAILAPSVVCSSTVSGNGSEKRLVKLEDLTVKQLRNELKTRGMAASGTKPTLLERLKPHEETILQSLATGQQQEDVEIEQDKPLQSTNESEQPAQSSSTSSSTEAMVDLQASPMKDFNSSPVMASFPNFATMNPSLVCNGGGFTASNIVAWQQAAAASMMGMQVPIFTPGSSTTPMLLPTTSILQQQQQFMQLMTDPRNWLPMQQMLQQQMLACSQNMLQASARVQQQQQAVLFAFQQQQQPSNTSSLQVPSSAMLAVSPTAHSPASDCSISASTTSPASLPHEMSSAAMPVKEMSSEELMLMQQQHQIQQLHSALNQSQRRLAEAEQQAEQQAKNWTTLQQQFYSAMPLNQAYQPQQQIYPVAVSQTGNSGLTSPQTVSTSATILQSPGVQQQQQVLPSISILQQDLRSGFKLPSPLCLPTSLGNRKQQQQHAVVTDPLLGGLLEKAPPQYYDQATRIGLV
jgi:hypothetical protein